MVAKKMVILLMSAVQVQVSLITFLCSKKFVPHIHDFYVDTRAELHHMPIILELNLNFNNNIVFVHTLSTMFILFMFLNFFFFLYIYVLFVYFCGNK
jgi:hypothetical protein